MSLQDAHHLCFPVSIHSRISSIQREWQDHWTEWTFSGLIRKQTKPDLLVKDLILSLKEWKRLKLLIWGKVSVLSVLWSETCSNCLIRRNVTGWQIQKNIVKKRIHSVLSFLEGKQADQIYSTSCRCHFHHVEIFRNHANLHGQKWRTYSYILK